MEKVVFGLLTQGKSLFDNDILTKLRELTISWCRYDYHGRIIEGASIDGILREALESGYSYCYIQSCGNIVTTYRNPQDWQRVTIPAAIEKWVENVDFFVTGYINETHGDFELSTQCLLVNLDYYRQWNLPSFDVEEEGRTELIRPALTSLGLEGIKEQTHYSKTTSGANFIIESLLHQKKVCRFNEDFEQLQLDLIANDQIKGLIHYLENGLTDFKVESGEYPITKVQERFLSRIDTQIKNSRQGVFLWNLESYDDIAFPPDNFHPPITSLYCVAAGFKANRILSTHGCTENTRMVFFDYSYKALEVKKFLHEEWDGDDFPRFVKTILKKFPYPETFYQLWAVVNPNDLSGKDIDTYWQNELEKWGGEKNFREHWKMFKQMKQEYVLCNLLTEQDVLINEIDTNPNSMIWWSNAFFTAFSNWHYTLDERKKIFISWIEKLQKKNPQLFITGADYMNIDINHSKVSDYLTKYREINPGFLNPQPFHKVELRF